MHTLLTVSVLSTLLAGVLCRPADPYAPPPKYSSPPVEYQDDPPNYKFNYAVEDDYSGSNYHHEEARDGYNTNGIYRVALPDGRIQTVQYSSDDNGFVADVSYEGEARYDEAPAYKPGPAPKYSPPAPKYPPPPPAPKYPPPPSYPQV